MTQPKKSPMSWPAAATAIATIAMVAAMLTGVLMPENKEKVINPQDEVHLKRHIEIEQKLQKHLEISENNFKQINQRLDTLLKAVLSTKK